MILPEIYTRSGYVRTPIYLRRLKKHGANILGDTVFSGICDVCMVFLIRLSHTLLNYKIKKQTKETLRKEVVLLGFHKITAAERCQNSLPPLS